MAFGKRVSGVATTFRVSPRRAAAPDVRHAAYPLALAAMIAGFLVTSLIASGWTLSRSPNSPYTFMDLLVLCLVKAGPTILVGNTIGMALADLALRKLKIRSVAAYVLACGLTPLLIFLPILAISNGVKLFGYYTALILPAAIAGGAVLGRFRRS